MSPRVSGLRHERGDSCWEGPQQAWGRPKARGPTQSARGSRAQRERADVASEVVRASGFGGVVDPPKRGSWGPPEGDRTPKNGVFEKHPFSGFPLLK